MFSKENLPRRTRDNSSEGPLNRNSLTPTLPSQGEGCGPHAGVVCLPTAGRWWLPPQALTVEAQARALQSTAQPQEAPHTASTWQAHPRGGYRTQEVRLLADGIHAEATPSSPWCAPCCARHRVRVPAHPGPRRRELPGAPCRRLSPRLCSQDRFSGDWEAPPPLCTPEGADRGGTRLDPQFI